MAVFKARYRKHKNRRKENQNEDPVDSNAVQILPAEQRDRRERFEKARAELRNPQMSSKKKKRLDKYIETKLKKEENLELLKKLAANKVDTSLLQSSKKLGIGKASKRDAMSQALEREKAGVASNGDFALLYDQREPDLDSDSDEHPQIQPVPLGTSEQLAKIPSGAKAQVGSGLKRPLEVDKEGMPVIKKRKREKKPATAAVQLSNELPWEGFSSDEGKSDQSDEELGSDMGTSQESDSEEEDYSDTDDDDEDGAPTSLLFSLIAQKEEEEKQAAENKARRGADFKAWAKERMNEARDFQPSQQLSNIESLEDVTKNISITPREMEQDQLPEELKINQPTINRTAHSVPVQRSDEIQEARLKLPVVGDEQKIMEAIHNHPAVIICGATGSGKTTQVPQFLFEAGYGNQDGPNPGMIGVTQPRRVAAVTMAERISGEMGDLKDKVSYQIRFERTVTSETAIKLMTDGVLIREIANDFALSKYSAIIIDEAHERSINTDILIGMMSRIVNLRQELAQEDPKCKPLKLIIMSATLMVEAFTRNSKLFPKTNPPLVQVEGRQHHVTMHFARRTQRDYLEDMYQKVVKGHRKLPPGAMLVFLTGQNEISGLTKRLRKTLMDQSAYTHHKVSIAAKEAPLEIDDIEIGDDRLVEDYVSDDYDSSDDEADEKDYEIGDSEPASANVLILPLYSQLPTKEQLRVFEPPPENTRLIILATNVAETSITIPGVRYVFDCGRVKEKKYDKSTGVQTFDIGWTSKASAAQRAGRAGRTGPGHCYRLYSSAVYERDFAEHTEPEVLRMPMEDVVLQLKSMDIQHVANFPFPTPPDTYSIQKAENLLAYLGALDKERKITKLGRELSLYPLPPRLAKMIALGHQHGAIYFVIALVASLAVPELFVPENTLDSDVHMTSGESASSYAGQEEESMRQKVHKAYNDAHKKFNRLDPSSDAIKLLSAFGSYTWATQNANASTHCASSFLRAKAMEETLRLYSQILKLVAANNPSAGLNPGALPVKLPSDVQVSALKQLIAAAYIDQVAIRADHAPDLALDLPRKPKWATDTPYLTLFPSHAASPPSTSAGRPPDSKVVFVHPSSVLARYAAKDMPKYLVYSRLQRSAPKVIDSGGGSGAAVRTPKTWMHPLTPVSEKQLAAFALGTDLLEWGAPIGKVEEREEEEAGGKKVRKRVGWAVPSLVGREVGGGRGREWPLKAEKVVQRRDARWRWVVERIL